MNDTDASEVVETAVRRWAQTHLAAMGPRLVALIVKDSGDLAVPATATRHDEPLLARLDSGAPLTPLSDPETGQDHLGAWGQVPSSVGDLLSARGADGQRVAAPPRAHVCHGGRQSGAAAHRSPRPRPPRARRATRSRTGRRPTRTSRRGRGRRAVCRGRGAVGRRAPRRGVRAAQGSAREAILWSC